MTGVLAQPDGRATHAAPEPAGPARHRLACLPTPLHRLPGLERALGVAELWVKRDDLTGFALAGNKARPLEFLLGAALQGGSDILVTGGAAGSNYCQAVAVAAAGLGLDCELVIAGHDQPPTVNLAVALAGNARVTYTERDDRDSVDLAIEDRAATLREQGRRPYVMPRGGATPVGGLGFACAAAELQVQLDAVGLEPARVVIATGSGGTQAGLLAGAAARGVSWPVHGASVSRPVDEIAERILQLAAACSELLDGPRPRAQDVHVRDARGLGFGRADEREVALTRQALWADGLVLDPTYTAKALLTAVDLTQREGGPTVFWHTGGTVSAITAWSHWGDPS